MRTDDRGCEYVDDDNDLAGVIERDMIFVEDKLLGPVARLNLIMSFSNDYELTAQDTVAWAPEFAVVVRMILRGMRPVKLRWLTDFDGERKEQR